MYFHKPQFGKCVSIPLFITRSRTSYDSHGYPQLQAGPLAYVDNNPVRCNLDQTQVDDFFEECRDYNTIGVCQPQASSEPKPPQKPNKTKPPGPVKDKIHGWISTLFNGHIVPHVGYITTAGVLTSFQRDKGILRRGITPIICQCLYIHQDSVPGDAFKRGVSRTRAVCSKLGHSLTQDKDLCKLTEVGADQFGEYCNGNSFQQIPAGQDNDPRNYRVNCLMAESPPPRKFRCACYNNLNDYNSDGTNAVCRDLHYKMEGSFCTGVTEPNTFTQRCANPAMFFHGSCQPM